MKTEDVMIALSFLEESDCIVLQCASRLDIPYIKREVHKLAGPVSKTIGNILYYDKKQIHIVDIPDYPRWCEFRESSLFYIGRDNDSDLTMLEIIGIDLSPIDIG